MSTSPIPITVVTGFLGSGKTTLILSLLKQLPTEYKVAVLKNEFGDVEVDSLLLAQSSLAAVGEILNGCLSVKPDAMMTVIDAENFMGYEDTSPTAKMQAQYTDLLVITKHESLFPDRLDTVLDHLHTLNDLTSKVKAKDRNGIATLYSA
ncbi:P-loop containing nucleoside triphosphate hydrolase protein [Mycena floridula]|nr:P-loop containing nucleoside triphosphate hydrolase protein [Mycena floridula]